MPRGVYEHHPRHTSPDPLPRWCMPPQQRTERYRLDDFMRDYVRMNHQPVRRSGTT